MTAGERQASELHPPEASLGRLQAETLYDVIRVVSSSADLDRMLDGIVELLSEATTCHACFIYLRDGRRLRLRAASRIYAHLVGQVEFGVDEGVAGWVARTNTPEFIRESAMTDPRMKYVPEMHEERFQSLCCVPIPARSGEVIGVVMLHTEAPREFGRWVLDFLSHTASLVAGAIENAQLLQHARRQVESLTGLSALSHEIAGAPGREQLYATVVRGVRRLLGCGTCQLHLLDGDTLELAACLPVEGPLPWPGGDASALLAGVLGGRSRDAHVLALGDVSALAVPVAAGDQPLGVLVVAGEGPSRDEGEELLRAVANQVAVALVRTELIERLTAENAVRDLFAFLAAGDVDSAEVRAKAMGRDLRHGLMLVHAEPAREPRGEQSWPTVAQRVEALIRRVAPDAVCDVNAGKLRAMLSLAHMRSDGSGPQALADTLGRIGREEGVAVGIGLAAGGLTEAPTALQEAMDAAQVARALLAEGGALPYADLGAYRYLVRMVPGEIPRDRYVEGVRRLLEYDARRQTQLLPTLEQYLTDRRSRARTAEALYIHPNTLRQRIERIEQLTGFELANDDLLSLELAIKVVRLQASAV